MIDVHRALNDGLVDPLTLKGGGKKGVYRDTK
jgi:hypothetical protein